MSYYSSSSSSGSFDEDEKPSLPEFIKKLSTLSKYSLSVFFLNLK